MSKFTYLQKKRSNMLLSLAIGITLSMHAEKVEIDGLYYDLNTTARTAEVTYQTTTAANYAELPANVTIPESVLYNNVSFTVTSIADKAFANCTSLESISIPGSVTEVGTASGRSSSSSSPSNLPFYGCTSLKSVRFENGTDVIRLGSNNYSFSSSSDYTGYGLFYSCPLEDVYIGRNISYNDYSSAYAFTSYPQRYGYSAFYNQTNLTKVIIGDGVTTIPPYAFYKCTNLITVDFGLSLTSIPKHAFNGCNISGINLPETVQNIEEYSFYSNKNLAYANLGSNVQNINANAFSGCSNISDIQLGTSLESIAVQAFYGVGANAGLQTIILPKTLQSIGNKAFCNSGLLSVDIPNSVSTIGTEAFANSKLESITIGTGCNILSESIFNGCMSLYSIKLSDGLTSIADKAFANCTSLESISIPGSVTEVGTASGRSSYSSSPLNLPFYGCTSLKYVRFEDGTDVIRLGSNNYSFSSSSDYTGYGLFYSCPLEDVYIGRNISYDDYSSAYTFASYPQRYGYSAFYNQPKLTKVTIGKTVTEIPAYLFYKNASLTLMTLPNVINIGKGAFSGCSKLTSLNFGESLTKVGDEAFYGCSNITKLTLPNSVQTIGTRSFYNCSSVTEVTIGSGLKTIGAAGFYGCKSFTALILPDTFTAMGESAFNGCAKLTVAKLGTSLTAVPSAAFKNCVSLSEMVLPPTVESIGDEAFYNDSGLATITMNEGLKTIGARVFWNNSGIMQFSIPGTVTSIGKNSFYGCTRAAYLTFRDGVETLTIDNTNCRSSKIDALTTTSTYYDRRYDYFYDCPIRFLTLGRNLMYTYSDEVSMYDLNGNTFRNVKRASAPFVNSTELRSVTIGSKVTFLNHHLFDGCANLATLRMGQNIETIRTYAFNNCDKLAAVDFPESLNLIGKYAFSNCDILQATTYKEASNHTLTIDDSAFRKCSELTEVTFPGQLKILGSSSFRDCVKLQTTIFNNALMDNSLEINDHAFSNCTALKTITFPSHLYKIHNYVYEKCPSLNELSFPGNLASIGNFVFKETAFLTNIQFMDSENAVTLGSGAANASGGDSQSLPLFGNSNLQSLYLGRNMEYDATSSYGYSPFYHQQWLTDVQFSQAGTVTYCKDYLLNSVSNCAKLILPESLKTIGSRTFASMTALDGITIPNKVIEIGTYAFSGDDGLKYAHLSNSCQWLKEGLFYSCDSLESIVIPSVVTKMDTKMFAGCKSLASVTFEGSSDLLEIGYGASQSDYGLFRDCPLETLNLDRWLSYNTVVASRAPFYSIATLKNLTLGENVSVVDKYMFSYCTGLEDLYLPDNIESVGLWGFRGCSSLKSVRFSEKLSQVSDYGFSECTSLDNVTFPESMTSVADNSFSNCTSLKKLDLGNKLMIIGPAAFKNNTSLEGIDIPESLYGLGVEAFANCSSLPNIKIQGITSVGKQAFQNCTGLKWVSLSDKTTSLGEDSFAGCSSINYVKSYAEFPPEGLVNFVEAVPVNGTLFVPESSIDYYQYSPTWETWSDIRPLNDNVMVTSVELNQDAISLRATETAQLTATVGAENATDKEVIWRTSDANVADVDADGLVTALSVGNATITALAADGSGIKAECIATVNPTMVESIDISTNLPYVKKGRSVEFSATVLPATATVKQIQWSSSDTDVATVDENGVVNGIAAGTVTITASATDESGVTGQFVLTVNAPLKGDSNDDDYVTITDAVNTANYAVGNEVKNFCMEAADVNGDNRVTLADASATVGIALDQSLETSKMKVVNNTASRHTLIGSDRFVVREPIVDNYETIIPVRLDNSIPYVALQADINVPAGMNVKGLQIGDGLVDTHTLTFRRINDRCIRIAIFDPENSSLGNYDDVVMNIVVDGNVDDAITLSNIIAADGDATEYLLTSSDEAVGAELTGDREDIDGDILITVINDRVIFNNVAGYDISINTVDGNEIRHFRTDNPSETITLNEGVYVVSAGSAVKKIIIKK